MHRQTRHYWEAKQVREQDLDVPQMLELWDWEIKATIVNILKNNRKEDKMH